ncbi:hypothetical protein GCM10023321_09190 [Pseudonocardia eucalypti]|uniref:Uncharacterized protein n=2 Tax=Pseudonocardia eucalypti TaxID=648755 RepID=A0ABP9PKV5_9PSEU
MLTWMKAKFWPAVLLAVALATGCASGGGDAPPPATNPTNADHLAQCQDGPCQVTVTAPAEFVLRGIRTELTVANGRVKLRQSTEDGSNNQVMSTGRGGRSSMSGDQGEVTIKVRSVEGNEVAMDIS